MLWNFGAHVQALYAKIPLAESPNRLETLLRSARFIMESILGRNDHIVATTPGGMMEIPPGTRVYLASNAWARRMALFTVLLYGAFRLFQLTRSPIGAFATLKSRYIGFLRSYTPQFGQSTTPFRSVFNATPLALAVTPRDHTHPKSAAARNAAAATISLLAKKLGRPLVMFQGSLADLRQGRDASN
jgi:hypothetical protein